MENLLEEKTEVHSKRQLFLQIIEILTEQGLLREDEKNRLKVLLTQLPKQERGMEWNGQ